MCVRGGGGEAVDLYSPSRSLSFFLSFCCSSNMQKSTKERERAQMSDKRVRGLRTAVYLFCGAVSIPFFFIHIKRLLKNRNNNYKQVFGGNYSSIGYKRTRRRERGEPSQVCSPVNVCV